MKQKFISLALAVMLLLAAGRHTAAAGGAVEIPAEQHTTAILARDIAPRGVLRLALFGNLLCGVEQGFVNDLQFGQVR